MTFEIDKPIASFNTLIRCEDLLEWIEGQDESPVIIFSDKVKSYLSIGIYSLGIASLNCPVAEAVDR